MFKYLGPETRKAVRLACEAAKTHRYRYVGTEHLFHGVIRADAAVVGTALEKLGIAPTDVSHALQELFENQAGDRAEALIPFTAHAKRAIESARGEATADRRQTVTCADLLIGLLAETTGVAAQIARHFQLDEVKLKKALDSLPQTAAAQGGAAAGDDRPAAEDDTDLFEGAGKPPSKPRLAPQGTTAVPADGGKRGLQTAKSTKPRTPALDAFGTDLTRRAREGALDPMIGRARELDRLIMVLTRRTKNNPILVGEPGTGKSALVEGLAQRIASNEVPAPLRKTRLISLDLPLMIAGTRYRGEFEERLERVMREAEANPEVLLFLDEVHTLVGAGSGEGTLDAANILKPALSRGRIRLVGATTTDEYRKSIEKDGALDRRFQVVPVSATNREETEAILEGLRSRLEAHHRASIAPAAISLAVGLAERCIAGRHQPDKSLDIIDEAAAAARARASRLPVELATLEDEATRLKRSIEEARTAGEPDRASSLASDLARVEAVRKRARSRWQAAAAAAPPVEVTEDDVRATVAKMTGIKLGNVAADNATAIGSPLELESVLAARVVGQPEACRAVARAVARAAAGLKDPRRPAGAFLFVGPTGVGKTLLAKALAAKVYGTEDALITVDTSELASRHDSSKLTGAPPGYVGHDRPTGLLERVRRRPQSVVLLDEVEKAHPDVLNLLLQMLEEGRMTDGTGRAVDFRHTIVILTSNVGQQELARSGGAGLGFAATRRTDDILRAPIEEHFRPELLNRLDAIVHFQPLGREALASILDLELTELKERLAARRNELRLTKGAREALLSDERLKDQGARPLRRLVDDRIVTPLADMILRGDVKEGDEVTLRLAATGGVELRVRTPAAAPAPAGEAPKPPLDPMAEPEAVEVA